MNALRININFSILLLLFNSIFSLWAVESRTLSSSSQSGVEYRSEFRVPLDIIGDEQPERKVRQSVLWHKIYDISRLRSLALGYNETVFFGGSDNFPVEAALYDLHDESNPPSALWTYQGAELSTWYVAASESEDIFVGINYLAAEDDVEGLGYSILYRWSKNSQTPLWSYNLDKYVPAYYEPLKISYDNRFIVVAVRDFENNTTEILYFEPDQWSPVETISVEGSTLQNLMISDDASVIGLLKGTEILVYDRLNAEIRQIIRVGASAKNFAMCGKGDYIASGWQYGVLHRWDGTRYREIYRHSDTDGIWFHSYSLISADGSTAVLSAYRSDYALNRVYLINLLSEELVWTYELQRDSGSFWQLLPAKSDIARDGSLFVLSNWGDSSAENPAAMVFSRGKTKPIYTLSPSGSIEHSVISSSSPYYFASAGKLTHMNEWGAGTNLFAVDLEQTDDYAMLEGIISDASSGKPVQGADVQVGDWKLSYSDQEGYYRFTEVIPGNYAVSISQQGYSDYLLEDYLIEDGASIVLDIKLQALSQLSITGQVSGNDSPAAGLKGAEVTLSGYADFAATTDDFGFFSFDGVYSDQEYVLEIDHTHYNLFRMELTSGSSDLNLGTIELQETAFPVADAVAVITEDKDVHINWSDPVMGILREFSYDNGIVIGAAGFNSGTEQSVLGAVHRNKSKILEISWHLSGETMHQGVNLFLFALDEEGYPLSGQKLYSVQNVVNNHNEWSHYELPQPVYAEKGFLVGISPFQGGNLGLSVDDGSSLTYNTQYTIFDYDQSSAFSGFFVGNFLIRAWGYDYGTVGYPDFPLTVREQETGFFAAEEDQRVSFQRGKKAVRQTTATTKSKQNEIEREAKKRALEGYIVYRFEAGDEGEFEKWDLVAETGDNYYLDREWNTLDNGEYRYAISAVYTADIFSPPLKTNKLIHDLDAIEPVYITKLYNNYPNPFNSSTTIEFSLESELPVSLQVFNLKGQLIDTLTEETYSQGKHSILWNGKHSKGKSVASGIYFFKMRAGGYSLTNKMVLIQ